MNKTVSIVLPVYKPNLTFLQETLISISNQEYKDFELIISDDSQTEYEDILCLINKCISGAEVKYILNKTEHGIFGNLNNAIKASSGTLIQIFSQDDVMKSTFLGDQVNNINRDVSIGLTFSAFDIIDDLGRLFTDRTSIAFSPSGDLLIEKEEAPFYYLKYGCLPGNISPVMIRKEVFERIGYFNQKYVFGGDFEFWIRVSCTCKQYYSSKRNLFVRRHFDQASFMISNDQLLQDLTEIYNSLINRIPLDNRKLAKNNINAKVGSLFVHHTVKKIVTGHWKGINFNMRYRLLSSYPFNFYSSCFYYFISIPKRVFHRMNYAK